MESTEHHEAAIEGAIDRAQEELSAIPFLRLLKRISDTIYDREEDVLRERQNTGAGQ